MGKFKSGMENQIDQAKATTILAGLFTPSQPFGPTKTETIIDSIYTAQDGMNESDRPKYLLELLQQLHPKDALQMSQPITLQSEAIVARRGCGKTAYAQMSIVHLNTEGRTANEFVKGLDDNSFLDSIYAAIELLQNGGSTGKSLPTKVSTDRSALLWEFCVLSVVMQRFRRVLLREGGYGIDIEHKSHIDKFFDAVGVSREESDQETLQKAADKSVDPKILSMLPDARSEVLTAIKNSQNLPPAFRIDQIDNFIKPKFESAAEIEKIEGFKLAGISIRSNVQSTIAGLLEFNQRCVALAPVRFFSCFPAEFYPRAKDWHGNPAHLQRHRLQWSSDDLLDVVNSRARFHMEFKHLSAWQRLKTRWMEADLDLEKQDSRKWFLSINTMMHSNGVSRHEMFSRLLINEEPIDYILRHTMLNPRHLIVILNHIWAVAKPSASGVAFHEDVRWEHVFSGVQNAAREVIVGGIIGVYRQVNPDVDKICDSIIPHLPSVFTRTYLSDILNRNNIRRYAKKHPTAFELEKVIDILLEIGAIGILTIPVTNKVAHGDFEYAMEGRFEDKIDIAAINKFCLHPIFACCYSDPPPKSLVDENNVRADDFDFENVDRDTIVVPHRPARAFSS